MIRYALTGGTKDGMTISTVVRSAQSSGGGPTPRIAAGEAISVRQSEYELIRLTSENEKLIATPLITCAGVVFASTDRSAPPIAAVYHAGGGYVDPRVLNNIWRDLGQPAPASLLVLYAMPNPIDDGYSSDIRTLETFGVPANQLVCIERLPSSSFGINSHGQVGY